MLLFKLLKNSLDLIYALKVLRNSVNASILEKTSLELLVSNPLLGGGGIFSVADLFRK